MTLASLETLKQDFSGDVILPEDNNYEQVRNAYIYKGSPAVVLRPNNAADVAAAIRYAKDRGLLLSIRSGGHSNAGHSTNNGGCVIDLSGINQVEVIDTAKHIVRVGAGAKWGNVAKALQPHHLAISSGDTVSVGVGGLTQGGGIGWMVRQHGLAIDSLVAAEIVTADGSILRASASENPDLFWGIRGGGGNFGVVTNFEFEAHPVGKVHAGVIMYALDDVPALVKGWRDYMRVAPEELSSALLLMPNFAEFPPGAMVLVCYAGDDATATMKALDPLLKIAPVLQQHVNEKEYADVLEEARPPAGIRILVRNAFVPEFTDDLVTTIAAAYAKSGTPALQIRSLGGAMNRVSADATAFAHRNAEVLFIAAMFLPPDADDALIKTALKPWDAISYTATGAYIGFFDSATAKEVAAIYPPATYQRLARLKKQYDPQNTFNQNYNVTPAD
ncbi:MAG: FAD-binding oxidoreductase [Anaerolineae bacterium]